MIQPNDLRINNLLKAGESIFKVVALSTNEIKTISLSGAEAPPASLEQYVYISLSEEYMQTIAGNDSGNLLISSLERTSDSSDMITLSTIECYLHDEGFLRICAYEYDKQPDGSLEISEDVITLGYEHIRYVHQLQNLYFSLSGKELALPAL